jgi:hypothetical protein
LEVLTVNEVDVVPGGVVTVVLLERCSAWH